MASSKGKGSSTSKSAKDSDEPANSKSTIVMLRAKSGLEAGSTHTVVDETPSRRHWLLETTYGEHGLKRSVEKNKVDDHWKWLSQGVIPVGEKRSSSSSSSIAGAK